MNKLVFATHNKNKFSEISSRLSDQFQMLSLSDLSFNEEIPEDFETLQENALQKARTIWERFGHNCFADDTGLEIKALKGKPGVYSARYAGSPPNSEKNIQKVLTEMRPHENRKAHFKTVIALIIDGSEHVFEGVIHGSITRMAMGTGGFGYDPIFTPQGFDRTFSEMSLVEKNAISHRSKAFQAMVDFLSSSQNGSKT